METIPEVGKVQSLATLLKIGEILNKEERLDGITLALMYNQLPEIYKELILSPYMLVASVVAVSIGFIIYCVLTEFFD